MTTNRVLLGQSTRGAIHAFRDKNTGLLYCGHNYSLSNIRYGDVDRISCGQCKRAHERLELRHCEDCGRKMGQGDYGKYCSACKIYHERYGKPRGRQRKPAYVEVGPKQLAKLYKEYKHEHKSLNELASREGMSLPTLRTRLREAGFSLRKHGKQTAQARAQREKTPYPQHPYAEATDSDVSEMEDSLLQVIEQAIYDGEQLSVDKLRERSLYSNASSIDAFYRLQQRGFIVGGLRCPRLTPKALDRRVRPSPSQRMQEVYVPGMNSGDLSRAAGTNHSSALNFIKQQVAAKRQLRPKAMVYADSLHNESA